MRASAIDSIVLLKTIQNIQNQFADYKVLPSYPQLSTYTEHPPLKPKVSKNEMKSISEQIKIIQYGLQIVSLITFNNNIRDV